MQQLMKGNRNAFDELYRRYHKKLLYFMYRILQDQDKAQDMLHDVFLKLIEAPEKYNPAQRFSTWIYTLALNGCRNEMRNLANRSRILEQVVKQYEVTQPAAAEYMVDRKLFRQAMENTYQEMSEREQLIFTLRFSAGTGNKENRRNYGLPRRHR